MTKNNCEIVRDLLPLYAENMCSEKSRRLVAEHLSECGECRKELEKISANVVIRADSDISAFKRVKRRARIEKAVIGIVCAVVILIAGWFAQLYMINTDCSMDYERFNLAENVWIDEDETGGLWMCRENAASSADLIYPTVTDKNGNHMGEEGFDKDNPVGYGVTLKHRKIDNFAMFEMPGAEERSYLFNINEKDFEYVFYYDDKTDTEYILWEREK